MAGKDYKVYLKDNGLVGGTDTLIEDQGDLTIRPGKPLERTNYKDGSKTAQGNDGWSASFTTGLREPVGTGQQLLFDAQDNGGDQYVVIKSPTSGAIQYAGPIKLSIEEITLPTTGEPGLQVELSEDGTITRTTTA